ncbi:MAG: helix-turn-helix domain-containing protein [Chlorobiaceae bacterium]|nr:helix-turn-helix domain-containing protein [Chlorobiaceae bacterium]
MEYLQTLPGLADDRLMASIRMIVRQELANVFPSESQDRLLTVAEAASMLRLAVTTIYGLVQRNQIPYIKKTKRLYFSERKLNEWLEQGENNGPEAIEKAVDTYLTLRKASHKRSK